MITAKALYGTKAHDQLRAFINLNFPQLTAGQRSYRLGLLTRWFISNFDSWYPVQDPSVINAFTWNDTPEGHNFWANVHYCRINDNWPTNVGKVKKAKPVGWWG